MESSKNKDAVDKFYLKYGFATRALHAGEKVGQPKTHAHTNAIYQTSTFIFDSAEEGADLFASKKEGYIYTRMGNPTALVVEAKLNALEGSEVKLKDPDNVRVSSLIFASGMGAISSTILAVMQSGDTMIYGSVLYGATDNLITTILPKYNINAIPCDTDNIGQFEEIMKKNPKTKLVLFETPTNPMMTITDIAALCKIAKSINPGVVIAVDNTFATPYLQRPLTLGADVVMHSTTKYIGGHGTIVGGAVITNRDDLKDKLYHVMKDFGACPSPFDAWLVNQGLKTLPLRMDRHCENAMKVAEFLEKHPKVDKVHYPGLKSFPQHELAKKQMKDFGGMVTFEIKGGYTAATKLLNNVHVMTLAVSLGGVDSLIQHPASMTHASVSPEVKKRLGISDNLIRLSVGLEDADDILTDLDQALLKM